MAFCLPLSSLYLASYVPVRKLHSTLSTQAKKKKKKKGIAQIGRHTIPVKCTMTAPLHMQEACKRQQSGHCYAFIGGMLRKAMLDEFVNPPKKLKWLERSHAPFSRALVKTAKWTY